MRYGLIRASRYADGQDVIQELRVEVLRPGRGAVNYLKRLRAEPQLHLRKPRGLSFVPQPFGELRKELRGYAPVYQPEEFCDSAYLYCRKQYGTDDKKKLVFEYCMTSFYGAICTVALLKEDTKQFESGKV